MAERTVNLAGNDLPLAGAALKVGQRAPDFTLTGNDLGEVTLSKTTGAVRVFAAVPSLDTPVCDRETRRFNQDVASLPGAHVYVVSMDLPFAQKRWCGAAGIDKVTPLSDHRAASFGEAWGVLIPAVRLLSRAVFVVDRSDILRYVEYVPKVGDEPSYEAALATVRSRL